MTAKTKEKTYHPSTQKPESSGGSVKHKTHKIGAAIATKEKTVLRRPEDADGQKVYELIAACPPLDTNSMYCNLLQCTHFSETCVLAEKDGKAVGFISAYIPPEQPDTLFVWQVAVHEDARGDGLGKKMLRRILGRSVCRDVKKIQTTITRDNKASWGLFRSFAKTIGNNCHDEVLFCRKEHFAGRHASEHLLTIGPQ